MRGQGFVAGVTGLIAAATVWGIWKVDTFTEAAIIAVIGFPVVVFGVILFTVVLEEGKGEGTYRRSQPKRLPPKRPKDWVRSDEEGPRA